MKQYRNYGKGKLIITLGPRQFFLITLSLIWSKFMVVNLPMGLLARFIGRQAINVITPILFLLLILLSAQYILIKVKQWDYILLVAFVFLYIFNMCVHYKEFNGLYLRDNIYQILVLNFGMYYIGLRIDDDELVNVMHGFSLINVVLFIFYLFFHITNFRFGQSDEFMGYAYLFLPHLCLVTGYSLRYKKAYDIIATIIGSILLIACGTRGPIILYITFILFSFLVISEKKHSLRNIVIAGTSLVIVYFLNQTILQAIYNVMTRLGTSTRIIEMILSKQLLNSRGRSTISEKMLELIKRNPIWGYGLAGDRGYTWTSYSSVYKINYAHNIFLELWVSFGVIFGTLLAIIIFSIVVRGFLKSRDDKIRILMMSLMFSNGLLYLFASGSYLLSPNFFFLMGICVSNIRRYDLRNMNRSNISNVALKKEIEEAHEDFDFE